MKIRAKSLTILGITSITLIKGEEIPIISRILTIVDFYDVMTHRRHYKEPISKETAIEELNRCSGGQFDPRLVELFISIINL